MVPVEPAAEPTGRETATGAPGRPSGISEPYGAGQLRAPGAHHCNDGGMLSGLRKDLTVVRPPLMSVRTTALLLAPVWLGFAGGALLGRPLDGLLAALGGYIVLFGGGEPPRPRLHTQLFVAAGQLAALALGMSVAHSTWLTLLAYVGAALVMVVVTRRGLDPGPPGPYFFVLMVGAGTLLIPVGAVARVLPVVALAAPWPCSPRSSTAGWNATPHSRTLPQRRPSAPGASWRGSSPRSCRPC